MLLVHIGQRAPALSKGDNPPTPESNHSAAETDDRAQAADGAIVPADKSHDGDQSGDDTECGPTDSLDRMSIGGVGVRRQNGEYGEKGHAEQPKG